MKNTILSATLKIDLSHLAFSKEFRSRLSEKLMELGNIAVGAMVFGPFVAKQQFLLTTLVSGIILSFVCYAVSYWISK